jgi:hypothetical protein
MRAVLLALAASSLAGSAFALPEVMSSPVPAAPQPPADCAKLETLTAAPDGTPLLKRLDQLPEAVREHAVWRMVEGCPVREIRFQGQTWYVVTAKPQLDSGPLRASRGPVRNYH